MGAWNDTPEPGEDLTCPDCEDGAEDCETCNGTGEIEPSEPNEDHIYETSKNK